MKRKYLASIVFASSLFALASCGNSDEESGESNEPKFVLSCDSLTLNLDDDYELGYTVENIEGTIRWSSSDNNIVGATSNKLIAKNEGQAVVTAQLGDLKRTCTVSVVNAGNGQYFVDSSKAINIDKASEGITPSFHYYVIEDGKKLEILGETPRYEVKDSAIAKIENGKIIPVSVGQTTVKVDYPKASSEFILNVCTKVIENTNQYLNMILNRDSGSFFALANDIDFTGKPYEGFSTSNDVYNYSAAFKGTLEGNGYTVKGIKLLGKSNHVSMFGVLNNAHIKDINFEDVVLENVNATSMSVIANAITGDDCEIKNVKVSCNFTGNSETNLNLITSNYLEKSYTNFESATKSTQVSFGSTKISNVIFEAKFNGKTMSEANCGVCPEDIYHFRPDFSNVLVCVPGGYSEDISGITFFENKLDLIWYVHNEKCLPDTNWDYSEPFKVPNLLKASSTSGFVYTQGTMAEIDSNYEVITVDNMGASKVVYPYGENIEGFVYGDHPTEKSKTAVFVNQRWAPYSTNLTVPAADLDITQFKKVCFFVRTKTFNKSFITIKDLKTNTDYSTLRYDCEVSNKWVKVEMEKVNTNNWTVYIGKDKIDHIYTANYFKEIPLRFNDAKYYYSEMLGVKDPNVIPKKWVSTGVVAKKTDGSTLSSTDQIVCPFVSSTTSSIVEGGSMSDLAKFVAQDKTQSLEFKFYARSATNDGNYFIISLNNSQVINDINHTPTQGLVSFNASSTSWTCFKFVLNGGKIEIYRNDQLLTEPLNCDFDDFGIQLSGGKFYVSEMFCYK